MIASSLSMCDGVNNHVMRAFHINCTWELQTYEFTQLIRTLKIATRSVPMFLLYRLVFK